MDDAPELDEAGGTTGIGVRWFEDVAKGRDPKVAANWSATEPIERLAVKQGVVTD